MADRDITGQPDVGPEAAAVIRRLRQVRQGSVAPRAEERCDFCGEPLPIEHRHVLGLRDRYLRCVCHACYLLFLPEGAGAGQYRAVPTRYQALGATGRDWWNQLPGPVELAFLFYHSGHSRFVLCYPSPHGVTESLLTIPTALAAELQAILTPDVEALLFWSHDNDTEAYLVPIDTCYELVGRLRTSWQGINGDAASRQALTMFFAHLRAICQERE